MIFLEKQVFVVAFPMFNHVFSPLVCLFLHFPTPLLFKLKPFDPILHALHLHFLFHDEVFVVEHFESLCMHTSFPATQLRYWYSRSVTGFRTYRTELIACAKATGRFTSIHDAALARDILGKLESALTGISIVTFLAAELALALWDIRFLLNGFEVSSALRYGRLGKITDGGVHSRWPACCSTLILLKVLLQAGVLDFKHVTCILDFLVYVTMRLA